jgi:hypothetical protein
MRVGQRSAHSKLKTVTPMRPSPSPALTSTDAALVVSISARSDVGVRIPAGAAL